MKEGDRVLVIVSAKDIEGNELSGMVGTIVTVHEGLNYCDVKLDNYPILTGFLPDEIMPHKSLKDYGL